MFARAATRVTPIARAAFQRRAMSAAAAPKPEAGFFKTWIVGMPTDVYPLAFIVTTACCGSFYMIGKHLITDQELRLLPDRVKATH